MVANRHRVRRSVESGFTLIEVLVVVAVLSVVGIGVMSVAFNGTAVAGDTLTTHVDARSAQLASVVFARDVQGASGFGSTACGVPADGDELVTLVSSVDESTVSYRDRTVGEVYELVRVECDSSGTIRSSRRILDDLSAAPRVVCSPVSCSTSGTPARVVTLEVTRSDSFSFALDGARRTAESEAVPPGLPADLFLYGGSTPLSVSGRGTLVVQGNAYVNSDLPDAVSVSGRNARLTVTGDLGILQGGGCRGCSAANVTPFPPLSFSTPLADPLAYLPVPDEAGLPVGACSGGVCTPGVYADQLSFNGDVNLLPGVYVLHRGFSATGNGTISGSGVLLYNGCGRNASAGCESGQGSFGVSGGTRLALSPATSGPYSGILLFQSRTNTTPVSISGGSQVTLLSGVLYAPNADRVVLSSGGGDLRLGAVIGRGLTVGGNGTVQVDGV